ncbi:MerR family transcriptional regulator [Neobacillus sp. MM2021_6]|uniref:MerR family transcriptional regulator n=1 Tax=Bacillaceae TaxID=186817 RepID=UPI00140D1AB8|nr:MULTISPECIES: MerR family transcriptional regulator [Bacillaceae]MBO0959824.1 MerR family transcriptional regulator [Neobacillus sp. MM2021_6]NHC20126.1 MerR family transcriptional regulator [Bacillus sp. MM2020_4]
MFTISEVAKETGFTAHTLRYYEKIGLLSSPIRYGGKRLYTAGDIRLLQFMKVLKNTGMSLEEIQEFLLDGCLLEDEDSEQERTPKVQKRMNILQKHLLTLEQQKKEIEMVIQLTEEKLETYQEMLDRGRKNEP